MPWIWGQGSRKAVEGSPWQISEQKRGYSGPYYSNPEDDAIAQSDMLVEAVVELESVKKQVLADVENQWLTQLSPPIRPLSPLTSR